MTKILIVEDDQEMLQLFQMRLAEEHELIKTDKPEVALALALRHKPDCIILDLSMPKFSGFELCQTLSSLGTTGSTPIFVVTASPNWMYKDFCLNLGASEYFEKPVDFVSLRERLSVVTDRSKLGRPRETRPRSGVVLKLRTTAAEGNPEEFLAVTEDVTTTGFLCACPAELESGVVLEVSMMGGGRERKVGRARMTRTEWVGTPARRFGFQFIDPPIDWLLT